MATVIGNGQVKLSSGKVVQAQNLGWYDGMQFVNGSLSQPGQIHPSSPQAGAGQPVSQEVIAQTNPANVAYVNQQRQQAGLQPSPATGVPASPQAPQAPQAPQTQVSEASTASGQGVGFQAPETINLPKLYESLYASSGIRDIEADLSGKTNAYNTQVAKIKDNPYLSEATMTGRIKKLDDKFRADTELTQNNIAMKKADIETQLNLQTKQFDINNAQTKLAWDQFNSLLSAGALDNANGEDIAGLTRATGISSSMIQSAIGLSKEKNKPKVNTQVIQVDDGTNVSAVVINQDTGEVINKQVIGASEPKKTTGGGATKTEIKAQETEQNKANLTQSVKNGITLKSLVNAYSGVLSIEEIYRIYNQFSPFGNAKETLAEVKQGKYTV